jgi:hypothetical protein
LRETNKSNIIYTPGKYAVIADIAGQYNALMRLVAQIPANYEIILLGDLIDRGPDSRKVVQWMIDNNIRSVYGNHEDMCCRCSERHIYERNIWDYNGGTATLKSYKKIPGLLNNHRKILEQLPLMITLDVEFNGFSKVILSHAPIHRKYPADVIEAELRQDIDNYYGLDGSIIWNRTPPARREYLQISGHNSQWGYREFKDSEGVFGYSLDQSANKKLTCLLIPDGTLLEERLVPARKKSDTPK